MKQIVHLNDQIRNEVTSIEAECELLGNRLKQIYKDDFLRINELVVIELIREKKGKPASKVDIYNTCYESYIEIGVEKDNVYFPNAYIPIWKCKQEMFHTVGYLINLNIQALEKKMKRIILEMWEDHKGELEINEEN
ncbi:hypothetical protein KHA94_11895 [Bacillus sp. FJAT-49705]|uniref:Phage protein n=1 Tax=Cytobacillus citreus TaxID=2833586 RepID=A0ABS5NSS2_9BACI|nr:hypothetical protein [Cytobacillus citreus]MBS4190885.1 hypothetical protein [Cytobacillus citreus]